MGAKPKGKRHGHRGAALFAGLLALTALYALFVCGNPNPFRTVGEVVDSLNGVSVHYNGGVGHTAGRNVAGGYNVGLRWQCVEFVKRYYRERLGHAMPDPWGNAKDFFDPALGDGALDPRRGLVRYANGASVPPAPDDILVFGPWLLNRYGHVAIVSRADGDAVEIVQQNPGPFASSRETLPLVFHEGTWRLEHPRVLGWLRLPEKK